MQKPTNGEILRFAEDADRLNILRGISECCRDDCCFDCPAYYPDERDYPYCSLRQGDFLELPVHADYLTKKGDEKK